MMAKVSKAKNGSLTEFASKARISIGYASQLLAGEREPTVPTALLIYRRTGRQLGILKRASAREAATVLKVAERSGTIPAEA